MSATTEQEIWDTLHRHLKSVYEGDAKTYAETTGADLSLYEWFVTPHRQDGLDFHLYMIEHRWAGVGSDYRFDLLEKRLQLYGDTAIATYTFMLTQSGAGAIEHHMHNETRVLVRREGRWQVVHVHKSPAWNAPREPREPQAPES